MPLFQLPDTPPTPAGLQAVLDETARNRREAVEAEQRSKLYRDLSARSEALAATYANNVVDEDGAFVDRRLSSLSTLAATVGTGAAQRTVADAGGSRFAFVAQADIAATLPGSLTAAQAVTLGIAVPAAAAPGAPDETGASGYWRRDHDAGDLRLAWADATTDHDGLWSAAAAYAAARPGTTVALPNAGAWGALEVSAPAVVPPFTSLTADGLSRVNQTSRFTPGLVVSGSHVRLRGDVELVGRPEDFHHESSPARRGRWTARELRERWTDANDGDYKTRYDETAGLLIQGADPADRVEDVRVEGWTVRDFGSRQVRVRYARDVVFAGGFYKGPDAYDEHEDTGHVRPGDNNAPVFDVLGHVDGFTITGGTVISGGTFGVLVTWPEVDNVVIEGFTIRNIHGQHGIYLSGSNRNLVIANGTIDGCALIGIKHQEGPQYRPRTYPSRGVVISNVTVRGTGGQGLTMECSDLAVGYVAAGNRVDGLVVDMGDTDAEAISLSGQYKAVLRATTFGGRRSCSVRSCAECEVDIVSIGAQQEAVNVYRAPRFASVSGDGVTLQRGNRVRVRSSDAGALNAGTFAAVQVIGEAECDIDVTATGRSHKHAVAIIEGGSVGGRVRGTGTASLVEVRAYADGPAAVLRGLVCESEGPVPALLVADEAVGHATLRGAATGNAATLTNCGQEAVLRVDCEVVGTGNQGVYIVGASTGEVEVTGFIDAPAQHAVLVAADTTRATVTCRGVAADRQAHGFAAFFAQAGTFRVTGCSTRFTRATESRALDAGAGVAVDASFNDFGTHGVRFEAGSLIRFTNTVSGRVART